MKKEISNKHGSDTCVLTTILLLFIACAIVESYSYYKEPKKTFIVVFVNNGSSDIRENKFPDKRQ